MGSEKSKRTTFILINVGSIKDDLKWTYDMMSCLTQVHVVCAWVLDLYYGVHGFDSFTGVLLLFESTAHYAQSTARCESTAVMFEGTASFIREGKIIMARIWRFIEEVIMKKIEYCLFDVVVEFHREMITSQLQGKLRLYDEVRARTLFVLSSSNRGRLLGIIDLMRQKNKRMKQEGLNRQIGILQKMEFDCKLMIGKLQDGVSNSKFTNIAFCTRSKGILFENNVLLLNQQISQKDIHKLPQARCPLLLTMLLTQMKSYVPSFLNKHPCLQLMMMKTCYKLMKMLWKKIDISWHGGYDTARDKEFMRKTGKTNDSSQRMGSLLTNQRVKVFNCQKLGPFCWMCRFAKDICYDGTDWNLNKMIGHGRFDAELCTLDKMDLTQRPKKKKIVKSIWVKKGSTVGSQAVLPQTVKKSAMINPKQTWKPKRKYLDSVNRGNGSYTLKQFEYGNPEEDLKDYAIIDSGCSGSMTGDKDKLSDFKEFKGGYVAFGNDSKYVKDILNKFDFRTIKPASTPIEAHKSLGKDEEGEDVDVHIYRSMIGKLQDVT
ncbi:hypothetical protein Tco_0984796 [Tanacetum coccineum]